MPKEANGSPPAQPSRASLLQPEHSWSQPVETLAVLWASPGGPDRALIYARTNLGDLPLDSSSWRVLDLKAK